MRKNENLLKREVVLPKHSLYLKEFNNQKAKNGTSFKESIKLLRESIYFAFLGRGGGEKMEKINEMVRFTRKKLNAYTCTLYQPKTNL